MTIFDGSWHAYAESNVRPPELEPQGSFTFAVNPANGELLPESRHGTNAITGTVNLALQSIDIRENIQGVGAIRFIGSVVFQDVVGDEPRAVACGRFILNGNAEAQEEGTWVITKP